MQTEKSLLHLVHRISQIGAERFAAVQGYDLRPRQLMVLRALAANPGARDHIAACRSPRSRPLHLQV